MKIVKVLALLCALYGCASELHMPSISECMNVSDSSYLHPKNDEFEALLEKYTLQGLPGLSVAVYSPNDGTWQGCAGYAAIENNQVLESCHLFASASVGKLYCAVALLKLQEEGFVDLDDLVSDYLPSDKVKAIAGNSSITIRNLLNHTSGMANIDYDVRFTTQILRDPGKIDRSFISDLIFDTAPNDMQGSFYYSSSGFEVLTLIIDKIVADGHQTYYSKMIEELGLEETYYQSGNEYPDLPNSVEYYLDRFNDGKLENITQTNNILTAALTGSDGVVASSLDHINFLRAIFEGQFLSEESLNQLKEQTPTKFKSKPFYGLGLWFKNTDFGLALGHDGGSIGAGADLWYFPDQEAYVFSATNNGIFFNDSRASELYREAFLKELFELVMK